MTKTIVADASVLLKAYLRDEADTSAVDAMLNDLAEGRLAIAAPYLLRYEVSNALWAAARQGRISSQDAIVAQAEFLKIRLAYSESDAMFTDALLLAQQYGRSVYDSAYLALAQQLDVWCFTGDRRLYNALHTHLNFVRWVGDYRWDEIPEPV
mgnify:CR=1 FL=1